MQQRRQHAPPMTVDLLDLILAARRAEVVHILWLYAVHLAEGIRLHSAKAWPVVVDVACSDLLVEVHTPTVLSRHGCVHF